MWPLPQFASAALHPFQWSSVFFLKRDSARYSRSQKGRIEWSTEKLPKKLEPNSCAWHICIIYLLSLSIPLSLSLSLACFFSDDAVVSACPRFTFGHSAPIELPDFSQQGGPRRISQFSCQFQAVQTFGHKKISSQVGLVEAARPMFQAKSKGFTGWRLMNAITIASMVCAFCLEGLSSPRNH